MLVADYASEEMRDRRAQCCCRKHPANMTATPDGQGVKLLASVRRAGYCLQRLQHCKSRL